MTMDFKYGIAWQGFIYGWFKKDLYRLPSESFGRHYPLKKLKKIPVGNQTGYCLKRKKLSVSQLTDMTIIIRKKIQRINSNDVPF